MSESANVTAAWMEVYRLSEKPDAKESAVVEAQARRVAAMLGTEIVASGALFAVESQAYYSLLARLAHKASS